MGMFARDVAVQRFFVHQHRDAETGAFHRPLLDGVDVFGGFARAAVGGLAGVTRSSRGSCGGRTQLAVGRAREHAHAVRMGGARLVDVEAGVRVLQCGLLLPQALHLRDLFFEIHAPQQILDARVDRCTGLLVQRRTAFGGFGCGGLRHGGARNNRHASEAGHAADRRQEFPAFDTHEVSSPLLVVMCPPVVAGGCLCIDAFV
jgi:hypothetical protein